MVEAELLPVGDSAATRRMIYGLTGEKAVLAWALLDSLLSYVYRENFLSISEIVEARTCCSLVWMLSLHDLR